MLRTLIDVPGRFRPDLVISFALIVAFLALAAGSGLVIASGKPIMMALAGGAIIGLILLNAPSVVMWVVLVGTLIASGPLLYHFAVLDRAVWLLSILGFFLLGVAALHSLLPGARRPGKPAVHIMLLLTFLLYGLLTLAWQEDAFAVGVGGMKRYFQFIGVAFVLAVMPFPQRSVKSWMRFLMILALVQLPYVAYQRFVVMPATGFTIDVVVGTYEALRSGAGNSGTMALVQVIALAGLAAAYVEGVLPGKKLVLLALLIVGPLVLSEVNVIFFTLPLAFVLVLPDVIKRRPMASLTVLIGGVSLFALAFAALLVFQQFTAAGAGRTRTVAERVESLIDYNFGKAGYANERDVNRKTVYEFWWNQHVNKDPVRILIGHGIGAVSSPEDQRSILLSKFPGTNLGLSTISQLLWETGVVGMLLFLAAFWSAFNCAVRIFKRAAPGFDRTVARILLASMGCWLLYTVYANSMLTAQSTEVLWGFSFGLLAWMERRLADPAANGRIFDFAAAAAPAARFPTAPAARFPTAPGVRFPTAPGVHFPTAPAARFPTAPADSADYELNPKG